MDRLTRVTGLSAAALGALAVVYVVWGSTYLGIKVALDGFPPMLLGAVRFLAAGAVLYAWAARRGAPRATPREWLGAAVIGILLLVGGNGAVTWAEQRIDTGIAALLIATVPLWMAVLGRIVDRDRLHPAAVIGLIAGFVGVGLLMRPSGHGVALLPSLVVVGGAVAWAAGSVYMRHAPTPANAARATSMQMLTGGLAFTVLAVASGELGRFDAAAVTLRAVGAMAYLVVFGSIVAYSAYTWLMRTTKPSIVSTYAYVNPFVAVLLGTLLLGEPVTAGMAVAAALIIVGVALIVTPADALRARRKAARAAVPAQPCTSDARL